MSTEDEGTGERWDRTEEYRDPTAPPPLEDPPPGSAPTEAIDAVTPGWTVPLEKPQSAPPPITYEQPTYTRPSYSLPSYDLPTAPPSPPPPPPSAAPPAPAPLPAPPQNGPSGYPPPTGPSGPPPSPYPPAASSAPGQVPPPGSAPPPPGAPYPYATPPTGYTSPGANTSAIVLVVVSALLLVSCCGVLELPALVMGVIGLARQNTDPAGSARITRKGWVAFGIGIVVSVLAAVAWFAITLATGSQGDVSISPGGI